MANEPLQVQEGFHVPGTAVHDGEQLLVHAGQLLLLLAVASCAGMVIGGPPILRSTDSDGQAVGRLRIATRAQEREHVLLVPVRNTLRAACRGAVVQPSLLREQNGGDHSGLDVLGLLRHRNAGVDGAVEVEQNRLHDVSVVLVNRGRVMPDRKTVRRVQPGITDQRNTDGRRPVGIDLSEDLVHCKSHPVAVAGVSCSSNSCSKALEPKWLRI